MCFFPTFVCAYAPQPPTEEVSPNPLSLPPPSFIVLSCFFRNAPHPGAFPFPADQQAFQHAVRQRDLLGLSCLLSHGFGLNAPLIEGLVESCGPRGVQDCFLEAVASAR